MKKDRMLHEFSNASLQPGIKLATSESLGELAKNRDFLKKKKKNLPASAGDIRDTGSISGLGRSSGGGYDNPLQYSCLENPMDRGAGRLHYMGSQESDTS